MAAKKQDWTAEIKKYAEAKNILIGTEQAIKNIKKATTKKVFLSSNCPSSIKETIMRYSSIKEIEVVELNQNNNELGVICKKPFAISVLCIKE